MVFSSTSSSKTPISTSRNPGIDSYYFPNCRKDANCHCEICIESFNATIDLHSALRFPPKKKNKQKNPSTPSTPPSTPEPVSSISINLRTQAPKSTAKSRPKENLRKKEKGRSWAIGYVVLVVFVGILTFWVVNFEVLEAGLKGFGPKLRVEIVRQFGEEAMVSDRGLNERLGVVERKVEELIGGENGRFCNCSSLDSVWKLNPVCYIPINGRGIECLGKPTTNLWDSRGRSLFSISNPFIRKNFGVARRQVSTNLENNNGSSWTVEKLSSAVVQLEEETWFWSTEETLCLMIRDWFNIYGKI